ncbi:hypothetical protein T484DRAFT_3628521 [Baffinella frigidus]|nr:hypothetical protein T484DRAFT_3628521 [Cryptophyta sp. CCMP2293]
MEAAFDDTELFVPYARLAPLCSSDEPLKRAGAAPHPNNSTSENNSTCEMEVAEKAITECVASAHILSDALSVPLVAGVSNGVRKNFLSNASPQIKQDMQFLQAFYTTPTFYTMTCSYPSYAPESPRSKQMRHALYKTTAATQTDAIPASAAPVSTATQTDAIPTSAAPVSTATQTDAIPASAASTSAASASATSVSAASGASGGSDAGATTTRHCCKCQKTASKIQKVKLTVWGGAVHCGPCRMKAWRKHRSLVPQRE